MDRQKLLKRLKNLKARAEDAGSTAGEAASARKIMAALMAEFGVSDAEVLAAEVSAAVGKYPTRQKPVAWEAMLVNRIARIFGCRRMMSWDVASGECRWILIGVGPNAEIAKYALDLSMRMIRKARTAYLKTQSARMKRSKKIERADIYCHGWVLEASDRISPWAISADCERALDAYVAERFGSVREGDVLDRTAGRKLGDGDMAAWHQGRADAGAAQLSRGVGAERRALTKS